MRNFVGVDSTEFVDCTALVQFRACAFKLNFSNVTSFKVRGCGICEIWREKITSSEGDWLLSNVEQDQWLWLNLIAGI